jgi:hypothetical protein
MYNPATKLKANIEAIKIALKYKSGDIQTAEDIKAVSEFSGWGGIKCVLYDPYNNVEWQEASQVDKKLQSMVLELHKVLKEYLTEKEYKETINSIKASILTSFYTPKVVPSTFYEVLQEYTDVSTIYEPSAGGGVFLTTAMEQLQDINRAVAYEKDIITGNILYYLSKSYRVPCAVHVCGFEESSLQEDGQFDLCASNVPFGSFPVFDPTIKDRNVTGKVHSYFLAKMLTKVKDGGVVAALVTNAFLDTPTNRTARRYLFSNCDFISLTVMPDNLMKESANTEAPSHFLVVRRRYGKTEADMSEEEQLLCESSVIPYIDITGDSTKQHLIACNHYVEHCRLENIEIAIGKRKIGKNQYGKPAVETWWDGPIDEIKKPFSAILRRDFDKRLGLSSTKLSTQTVFPVGKLEVVNPNTFKWVKDHIIVATIPKIEETAVGTKESEDITGTCIGCGVGMFGSELLCSNCYDENVMSDPSYYPAGDLWSEKEDYTESKEVAEQQGDAYDNEQADRMLQQLANMMADKHGLPRPNLLEPVANIVDKCDKETLQPADNQSIITENTTSTLTEETLQLLCNNPALEYKIGTIVSVTTGNQQNLFEEKTQLYIITATDSQGRPTAAELVTDIKEGREQRILEAYANIRDYYYELQKEEQ